MKMQLNFEIEFSVVVENFQRELKFFQASVKLQQNNPVS